MGTHAFWTSPSFQCALRLDADLSNLPQPVVTASLDINAPDIMLESDAQYDAVFKAMLCAAVKQACQGQHEVAVELSGGFDSSCVALTLNELGQKFHGFCHADFDASGEAQFERVQQLVDQCEYGRLSRVDVSGFEPISVFEKVAQLFNGMPPYIFVTFAEPLFKQVQAQGYQVLLSGFGGDECVTSHALSWPRQLACAKQYRKLWAQLSYKGSLKNRLSLFVRALCPNLHQKLRNPSAYLALASPDFNSIREQEAALLKGNERTHVCLRVQSSERMAREFGFAYQYPLLNHDLLDWCFRLPLDQKVRKGRGREIARRYLCQYMPEQWVEGAAKKDGIFSASMSVFKRRYEAGEFDSLLNASPLLKHMPAGLSDTQIMIAKILAYQAEYAQD